MKKINLTMATIAVVMLIGCGGGGSSSNDGTNSDGTAKDPFKIQEVSYTLNGSEFPSCNKPSSQSISKAQRADDLGVAGCTWICGSYEGASPVTVKLTFIQNGKDAPWVFDGDLLITAPDQCHN